MGSGRFSGMETNRDMLIREARDAASATRATGAVRTLMKEALADPDALADALGSLDDKDEALLFEDDTVSVWHCRFWPGKEVPPHEHRMPAFIGVYRGAESNTFYRRDAAGLHAVKTRQVRAGQVLSIGSDGIHSVSATGDAPSHALHIYLGPLSRVERSLFRWETGEPLPFTDENFMALTRRDPAV